MKLLIDYRVLFMNIVTRYIVNYSDDMESS